MDLSRATLGCEYKHRAQTTISLSLNLARPDPGNTTHNTLQLLDTIVVHTKHNLITVPLSVTENQSQLNTLRLL